MAAQVPGTPVTLIGSPLQRLAIFQMYGVSTSDTVQLSTWFTRITSWVWVPATGSSATTASTSVTSNTQITLSPASISVDDGYVVAIGASAQQ